MWSRTGQARLGRGWNDSIVMWGQGHLQGSPGRKRRARRLSSQEQGKGTQGRQGSMAGGRRGTQGGQWGGGAQGGPRGTRGGEVGGLGG